MYCFDYTQQKNEVWERVYRSHSVGQALGLSAYEQWQFVDRTNITLLEWFEGNFIREIYIMCSRMIHKLQSCLPLNFVTSVAGGISHILWQSSNLILCVDPF